MVTGWRLWGLWKDLRSWSYILALGSHELHHTSHPRNADVFSCSFLGDSLVFYLGSKVACNNAAAWALKLVWQQRTVTTIMWDHILFCRVPGLEALQKIPDHLPCQFRAQQLLTTERKSPAPIIIIFLPRHMQEDKPAHSLAFMKWSLTSRLSQESNFNNLWMPVL